MLDMQPPGWDNNCSVPHWAVWISWPTNEAGDPRTARSEIIFVLNVHTQPGIDAASAQNI